MVKLSMRKAITEIVMANVLEADGTYVFTAQYEDDRKPAKKTTRKKTTRADS